MARCGGPVPSRLPMAPLAMPINAVTQTKMHPLIALSPSFGCFAVPLSEFLRTTE